MGDASPAAASPRPAAAVPWAACQAAASILRRRRRQSRRPPRPQLSRSRHANFWLGTKGSARAGRGRALLPLVAPRGPLARCSLEVLGWRAALSPFPHRRAAPPGQPPWKPGSAKRRAQGRRAEAEPRRRQGKGATRAEREGAAERIGDRGTEGGASARFWARESERQALGSASPRPPASSAPPGPRESPAPGRARGRELHCASLGRAAQIP